METYQWILLTIYLCINCFMAGTEYEENGMSWWVCFGIFFYMPACAIAFIFVILSDDESLKP